MFFSGLGVRGQALAEFTAGGAMNAARGEIIP